MRDEIRKRIEAVRRGEIPDGYIVENHQLRLLDWKYEKIGKYLVAHDEYSNDTERYMLATSSRQGLLPQTDYYNDQRFEETTGGFHVVPEGYVTYRHMSDDDVFKFNVNDLGAPVLVSPEYPVFTTNAELNQSLLIEYLNGTNEFRSFCRAQKKGSTRTRMYFSRLGEFMMPIPPISEQQKIADILSACDRVIELKEKRVEELKQLKKTCLAKMFPREGEDVPELRFPGFTAPWEQRKLGDLSDIRTGPFGSTLHAEDYVEDGVPIITTEHFKAGTLQRVKMGLPQVSNDDYYRLSAYVLIRGDIVFSRVGSVDVNALITPFQEGWLFSGRVLRVRPFKDYSSSFLHVALDTDTVKNDIRSRAVGQTMPSINTEILKVTGLRVPISLEEQEQIGEFLTRIDNLITLHQREVEAEQQKKKALMQLLLTGLVRV